MLDGAQDRQCGRKVIYPDQEHAVTASKLMHKRHKAAFAGYHCPWCNGWHVGRVRSQFAARRREERRAA